MPQPKPHRTQTPETRVLALLSQGAPLLEVLKELCKFLAAELPGIIPAFFLLDPDGKHLQLAAGPAIPATWNQFLDGLTIPSYASFHGSSARHEKMSHIIDLSSDPSFANCWASVAKEGIQRIWSAPILSKDRDLLGILILLSPLALPPDDRDIELMDQAIHMAAIALRSHRSENELCEVFRRLYQSQDQERRRIARELHDSTGQKLAVLGMNLVMAKECIATQPGETDKLLIESSSLARNISDELRTLSYLLHPPLLDECGLHTAVEWYVSGINERDGFHVDVEIANGLRRLTEEAKLAVFRVVQASLTNVHLHLHSGAGTAKVIIDQNKNGILVTISDKGRGIPAGILDHSSLTHSVGIGIAGMRERVKQLGGVLEIETGRHGTIVKATVPARHFRAPAPDAPAEKPAHIHPMGRERASQIKQTPVYSLAKLAYVQSPPAQHETSTQFGRARSQMLSHPEIRR